MSDAESKSNLSREDQHRLSSAIGWLGLGNADEAEAEWRLMSQTGRDTPEALDVQWSIISKREDWPLALAIAEKHIENEVDHPQGWIHKSYALHEMKRTEDAWENLLQAAPMFPSEWMISYNLACYACQLGNLEESRIWLKKAVKVGGAKAVKTMALDDPDLIPLRDEIEVEY